MIPDVQITGLCANIKTLLADTNKTQIAQFTFTKAGIDEEEDIDRYMQFHIYHMVQ